MHMTNSGTTIQINNKAERLAEEPEWCVMFTVDASADRLAVAHRQNKDYILCLCYVCYGCLNRWTCCSTWTLLIINVVNVIKLCCCFVMLYWLDLLWRQQAHQLVTCVMIILWVVQIVLLCVILFRSSKLLETFLIWVDRGGQFFMSLFTQGAAAISLSGGGRRYIL